jgi:hypothetical protein
LLAQLDLGYASSVTRRAKVNTQRSQKGEPEPFDEGALTGGITPEITFEDGDFRNDYFRGDRKQEV